MINILKRVFRIFGEERRIDKIAMGIVSPWGYLEIRSLIGKDEFLRTIALQNRSDIIMDILRDCAAEGVHPDRYKQVLNRRGRDSMRVASRHIKGDRYEVEGVIIHADSMVEAVSKWTREPKK